MNQVTIWKLIFLSCVLIVIYLKINDITLIASNKKFTNIHELAKAEKKSMQYNLIVRLLELPVDVLRGINKPSDNNLISIKPKTLDQVKNITQCVDKPLLHKIEQRGEYWVLYNYIIAEKQHRCHESITYTTQADYTFIDNLISIVELWHGPVSVALFAPGTDFKKTLDSIAYLRECTQGGVLIKKFVTFHIYFNDRHIPEEVRKIFCISICALG